MLLAPRDPETLVLRLPVDCSSRFWVAAAAAAVNHEANRWPWRLCCTALQKTRATGSRTGRVLLALVAGAPTISVALSRCLTD